MINKLQRLLYALGIIAPIPMAASIVYSIRVGSVPVKMVIVMFASAVAVAYQFWFLWYSKRSLARIELTPDTVPEEADKESIEFLLTYATPLLEWLLEEKCEVMVKWHLSGVVCIVLLIIITSMNNTASSPWYRLIGYHFYKIEAAGKRYTIMSTNMNYRNKKKISGVKRLFNDMLIVE